MRPELTYEEFCATPLEYTFGIRYVDGATRIHANSDIGLTRQIWTPQDKFGNWGEQKATYFIDGGDENGYENPAIAYEVYMSLVCGVKHDMD